MGDECIKNGKVDTLGTLKPQLAGNLTALLLSALVCSIVSFSKPQNFDWKIYSEKISLIDDDGGSATSSEVPDWEMSEEFLNSAKAWIIMWGWAAAIMIIGLPIYENRKTFMAVLTCNTSAGSGGAAVKKSVEVGTTAA